MKHAQLVEIALRELDNRGISRSDSAPTGLEVLWTFGIPLRPMHYMRFPTVVALIAMCGFAALAIFKAMFFTIAVMSDSQWHSYYERGHLLNFVAQSLLVSGFVSVAVAICFAIYYRWQVWGTHLPPWEELADVSSELDLARQHNRL